MVTHVVKVKDGYARNYLFPRKLAVRATKEAKLEIENNRAAVEAQFQKELALAGDVAAKLSQISVNLERRVVEGERLYGSVTAGDIAEAITKAGVMTSLKQSPRLVSRFLVLRSTLLNRSSSSVFTP